jgi:hypothetical protein
VAVVAELGLVAHGGVYGAIGEGLLAVAIAAFFVAVWLRERKRGERAPAEVNDEELR